MLVVLRFDCALAAAILLTTENEAMLILLETDAPASLPGRPDAAVQAAYKRGGNRKSTGLLHSVAHGDARSSIPGRRPQHPGGRWQDYRPLRCRTDVPGGRTRE